jgi:predicted ABC-type sugar transport system permease subunit
MNNETTVQTVEEIKAPARKAGWFSRMLGFIGADNLSLIFALILLVFLVTVVSGWFGMTGGDKFFSHGKPMNSLAQAIVIVGLLSVGETVVALAGAMDISVGSVPPLVCGGGFGSRGCGNGRGIAILPSATPSLPFWAASPPV